MLIWIVFFLKFAIKVDLIVDLATVLIIIRAWTIDFVVILVYQIIIDAESINLVVFKTKFLLIKTNDELRVVLKVAIEIFFIPALIQV